jgi:O-antigen/teichoic acid export membrane protein
MSTVAGRSPIPPHLNSAAGISPRALTVNYFLLSGGELLSKLAAFFAFTRLGRVLGAARYGSIEFAIALIVLFSWPVAFGLEEYGSREIARRRHAGLPNQLALAYEIAVLRLCLAFTSLAVLAGVIWILPRGAEDKQLLAMYGASLLLLPWLTHWFFQGCDDMAWSGFLSIVRNSTFAVLVLVFFNANRPLYHVGIYECTAVAVTALAGFLGLHRRFRRGIASPRISARRDLWPHLTAAAPIGFATLSAIALWYLPTLVLGLRAEPRVLGEFGVAHRITISLHTFVWLYFVNLLPSLTRAAHDRKRLRELLGASLTISSWGALLVALVVVIAAGPLVDRSYGSGFHSAAPVLATLIVIIPIMMISGHYRYLLVAAGQQKWLMRWSLLAAGVTLITVLLASRAGSLGAACAILAGGLVQLVLTYRSVCRQVVDLPFWRPMARPCLAFGGALGLDLLLRPVSPGAAAVVSFAAFLLALWIFERRRLLQGIALLGTPQQERAA